jgi:phage terminase large subunit-like protein
LSTALLDAMLSDLPAPDADELDKRYRHDWSMWARPKQREPQGEWDVLGLVAGRGGGKSRSGAEMVRRRAEKYPGIRIALVGRTAADVRDVMVLGKSGLLAVASPWCRPVYQPTNRVVRWPNGSEAHMYSADKPDQVRGPEHQFAWCDEFAAWRYPLAWDLLQDGLRLNAIPGLPCQVVLTTTPRRTDLVADTFLGPRDPVTTKRPITPEMAAKLSEWEFTVTIDDEETGQPVAHRTVVRRWRSEENAANNAAGYVAKRRAKYGKSTLGRQELDAEILEVVDGALWRQKTIDAHRRDGSPELERIEVAVDPTRSDDPYDECGIVVGGVGKDGHCYILADYTVKGPPLQWVKAATNAYHQHKAAAIIYEGNGVGEDVRNTIRAVSPGVKWVEVNAGADKAVRASAPSALYEEGRVHHVQTEAQEAKGENPLAMLEEEMCTWDPREPKLSPNRLDALVWLVQSLMIGVRPVLVAPRITGTRPSGWRTQG